jgi:hypothetical protein
MDQNNGTISHFSSIPAKYQAPICKTRGHGFSPLFIVSNWDVVSCKKCLAKKPAAK